MDSDKYEKEDARDFVLWKAAKPGEPSWEPGLPKGRPGWHIECSAMAEELLGELPIDIHGGGVDLIFPHHENEIAQAEGATNRTFSRFWVHVEHLMIETDEDPDAVKTEKMSKSLGNVYNLEDIVDARVPAVDAALPLSGHALPEAVEVLVDAVEAVRRVAQAADGLPGAHA